MKGPPSLLMMCEELHMYCHGGNDIGPDDAAKVAEAIRFRLLKWKSSPDHYRWAAKRYDAWVKALAEMVHHEYNDHLARERTSGLAWKSNV